MERNFPCFVSAYMDYARDGFCPDRFHKWVALSLVAAVVERKVTLKQDLIYYIPNIYVMLVSHPKQGKTTAIVRGSELIEDMRKDLVPQFRVIPTRTTDAAFIDMMRIAQLIPLGGGKELKQSAGFFYADEASASALQNLYGDFVASLTAFYDCPRFYRDKTKGNPILTEIENACMNLLAGTTFNYLKELVNDKTVEGGFASRLLYVVSPERKVRESGWERGLVFSEDRKKKLIADLAHMNKLVGPMKPTAEWKEKYAKWQPDFDRSLIELNSASLESISARKDMNLIKVSMLLSISEGDSLVIEGKHFDEALCLINDVYKDVPSVLSQATIADKMSQKGTTQFLAQTVKKRGGVLQKKILTSLALSHGNEVKRVTETLDEMIGSGWFEYDTSSGVLKLLIDPDRYL